mgnify:CR=1 FL=1
MTIAIDFDGTIVEHRYPKIGNEIPFATDTLKIQAAIFAPTLRKYAMPGEQVPVLDVVKLGVEGLHDRMDMIYFIDDRNLGGLPDWGDIYRMVQEKLTYEELYRDTDKTPQQKRGGFWSRFRK